MSGESTMLLVLGERFLESWLLRSAPRALLSCPPPFLSFHPFRAEE